jgi:hypothetical protein
MTNYHQYHMPRALVGPGRVLTSMLKCGKYYPAASWAMSAYGKGLNLNKLNATWKSIIMPE